ncbi:MAG: hypothetical protein JXR94_14785 [Candidatus Hydrogenedentes bacterium]|nr:hypothetical protein [Candidatus Hydrogenedentota bacterium]
MDRYTFGEICRARRMSWGSVLLQNISPYAVRIMARAGFDWLWIDNEHSWHSYETIQEAVRTAEDVGIVSILRVAQGEYTRIAQALDMGVDGIIVPRVETPEQVRYIVDCAKYPPVGKRGFGLRPSMIGRRRASMAERIADQNEHRFLFFQVESRLAVDNLEAMLDAADGQVDGVFFGPADFLLDLGKPDAPDAPELEAAAREAVRICAGRGISNGVPVGTLADAKRWRDFGFNLITFGSEDAFLANAADDAREQLRAIDAP